MRRSDWALIALNLFTAFVSFVATADGDEDLAVVTFFILCITLAVNSAVIARRSRQRDDAPRRDSRRQDAEVDELDARTVLDLDARLEALERAQADAADAAKWRALVESGQVSGPSAPLADAADESRQRRNGLA